VAASQEALHESTQYSRSSANDSYRAERSRNARAKQSAAHNSANRSKSFPFLVGFVIVAIESGRISTC
jgi:uncharacterized MAPEG superfamily protein